jgi:cell division cycle protein 20 (cofactor of APC complex)
MFDSFLLLTLSFLFIEITRLITDMSHNVVDYENLMETSFTDNNSSVRTGVRPRWERKQAQQSKSAAPKTLTEQKEERRPILGSNTNTVSSLTSSSTATTSKHGDRFIPNRSGMNLDLSQHLMRTTTSSSNNNNTSVDYGEYDNDNTSSSISEAMKHVYNANLSSCLLGVDGGDVQNNRILAYQEKAPAPKGDTVNNLNVLYSCSAASVGKSRANTKLVTRSLPSEPARILDAPDMKDDFYLNLISWSDTNVLAVALTDTVYLWNAESGDIQELCQVEGPGAHISSVSWVQEGGFHLAVGTSCGKTQLWDVQQCKLLRTMDGHSDRVGSLAWNRHILTSASRDTTIVNHDVRVAQHNVACMWGHSQEICGLAWSLDGETLASGGNDNLLCLWDAAASTGRAPRFSLNDHQAAVKAMAWSPHERNLLASGGGTADRTIKFWNTQTGSVLNSMNTGSQVCALKWNPFEKEILSSHGFARYQLSLWKYPSMAKIKDFEGHTSRVLHMAVSPDGSTVVSAAGDETLRFWNIFAPPSKPRATETAGMAFAGTKGKTSWTAQIR